jgi:hypothetical protein
MAAMNGALALETYLFHNHEHRQPAPSSQVFTRWTASSLLASPNFACHPPSVFTHLGFIFLLEEQVGRPISAPLPAQTD